MTVFKLIEEESATQDIVNNYAKVKATWGITFVPDFFKVIANQSNVFDGIWAGYKNILADGLLPAEVKEMIFLTVALQRGCVYCSSTHLAICDMLEVPKDTLETIKSNLASVNPERIKDILSFVEKTVNSPDQVTDQDYSNINGHGIAEDEIIEILAMVFLSNTAVNMALAMGMRNIETQISDYLSTENLKTGLEAA